MAKLLFGLCLIAALLWMTDLQKLELAVRSVDLVFLLLGFGLFVVQGVCESFRLSMVFAGYGVSPRLGFKLFLVGLFFSNFMPGMIGADAYQVQQMHAIRPGLLRPVSLSLYLRTSGLAVNAALAALALALGPKYWFPNMELWPEGFSIPAWIGYAVVITTVIVALIILSRPGRTLLRGLIRRLASVLAEVVSVARSFATSEHLVILGIGAMVVFVRVLGLIVLTWAFDHPISFLNALVAVTVTTCALVLPLTVGGLGVRELSIIAFLVSFGVPYPAAVAISLVGRFYTWAMSAIGGFWFAVDRGHKEAHTNSRQDLGPAE